MKKALLIIFLGLLLINANGQTTATDFTVNDCAGNSHTLFTELDAGKVIVLDWVMPCASCIAPSVSAYNIAQSYQSSNPGRVLFYLSDDVANTSCTTLNSWAATNSMPNSTKFSNAAIKMTDYGTAGMPKIVVLGGSSHTVYYNANNSINASALTTAINLALNANTGIIESENAFFSLNVFPNPSTNISNISYSIKKTSNIRIDIYNIVGEKVQPVFSGNQNAGEHIANINTQGFRDGIYFIKLIVDNSEQTIKLSVIH